MPAPGALISPSQVSVLPACTVGGGAGKRVGSSGNLCAYKRAATFRPWEPGCRLCSPRWDRLPSGNGPALPLEGFSPSGDFRSWDGGRTR